MTATSDNVHARSPGLRLELAKESRRIFLALEASGEIHDDATVDAEIASMLIILRARLPFDALSVPDEETHAIISHERERVHDAVALADLVAPRVAALLRQSSSTHSLRASPGPPTPSRPPAITFASATPPASIHAPDTAPPGIADLIDGMLEQERTNTRPPPSRHR